jgi:hypothetical protein
MLSGEFLALRKEVIALRERAARVRHLEADNALLHLSVARLEHENKNLRQALGIVQRRMREEEDRRVAEATTIAELGRRSRTQGSPSPTRRMASPAPPRTLEELRVHLSASPPTTPRPRTQSPAPYRSPQRGADGWATVELSMLSRHSAGEHSSPSRLAMALSPVRRLCSTSPVRTTPVALSRRLAEQQPHLRSGGQTVRHAVRAPSPPSGVASLALPLQKPPLGRPGIGVLNASSIATDDSDQTDFIPGDDGREDNPLARAIFY